MRRWCAALGEPTFVGTSGRVFPRSFKASPLLRAWLRRLDGLGVALRLRHRLVGFAGSGDAVFSGPDGERAERAGAILLACGGASWPRLGSDGGWVGPLRGLGVAVAPLRPANCGFEIGWSEAFRARFSGAPLKTIALRFAGETVRGEAVATAAGLEGGAIYALAAPLREAIAARGEAVLEVDLKPDLSIEALAARLARPRGGQSFATFLRKAAALSPVAIALLRESGAPPSDPGALAQAIKAAPLRLTGTAPIARAISSAGGVAWSEIDADFMVTRRPGLFVAGEMLDWEAPTGGFLLQACFSTGAAAARGALKWLDR